MSAVLDRREFLKRLGGGIFVFAAVPDFLPAGNEPDAAQGGGRGLPSDFNAFLRIAADGRVTGYTGKIEQGQGANTSLPLLLAEELDVDPAMVDLVMGDTDLCPYDAGTFGSQSIRIFGPAFRAAAAEARAVLRELAAERLGVAADRLRTRNGVVFDPARPEVKVSYGELAGGRTIERHVTPKPALKPAAELMVMGRPAARRDAAAKVTGAAKFAGDLRVPGMLYARLLRPPAHGSKLLRLDASGADAVVGALVVRDGDLIAVLHELPDRAEAALAAVKAEWEEPESGLDDSNIFDHLIKSAAPGRAVAQGGDPAEGAKSAAVVFDETYTNAYVAHAPMEPHTALVELKDGQARAWASTQSPFRLKEDVAQALGIPPASVHVQMPFVGGGFGGKTRNLQAVQAARLVKAVGRPVQVAWSREDEFFWDTFRPAAVVKIKSGLTAAGRISHWDYEVLFAGERSSQQFYDIAHHRTVVRGEWSGGGGTSAHPFDTGAWRGPASNTNTYAREAHIDAMAAKAGRDPLEFRLANLANPRMARVLQAAAKAFGWAPRPAPNQQRGSGRGLACADYLGTYVATMAEIGVDLASGRVRVGRMVCAHDSGIAVNPEGMRLQIEGCMTMGLGYSLTEEVHFKGRRVLDLNYDTYELPRFSWLPKIESVLVDSPDVPIAGGGEPAITTVGAVLANAVYDATGVRLRHLPMTPARIKAGLTGRASAPSA